MVSCTKYHGDTMVNYQKMLQNNMIKDFKEYILSWHCPKYHGKFTKHIASVKSMVELWYVHL